jgi:OPA family glycerol-3-phosphate transporter-like MFS transporter
MTTRLTSEHRTWRYKIFASTWLSYVGFYFCRKPWNSTKAAIQAQNHWDAATIGNIGAAYLIAYAVGQFLASRMGPALGPRRNVLLGMALSIAVTLGMTSAPSPYVMGALISVLGLAQATGWSGNVGTMANWFHKHERGRVMGAWSTNFTVGSLASAAIFGLVLGDLDPAAQPWQRCFYVGAAVLAVVWVQFFLLQRTRPEDVGLVPIDDPVTAVDESKITNEKVELSREQWTNLMLVGGFYFFVKLVRYAIWGWAAYFLEVKYGLKGKAANIYSITFDVCGIPGVYVTGWLSDRFFGSRRAEVALIMMIGMTAATGLLMAFASSDVLVFTVLLGVVGFFLFGPDALLTGAGAMDIGNRRTATFAAAVISGFGSIGPIVQEVIIPRVYDEKTEGMGVIFAILFVSAICAAVFCGLLVWRNRRGGKGI